MNIDPQMQKGVIEGCVLKIIYEKEVYSAQIVNIMREKGFKDFSEGTLYPLLLRLEKEGYLLHRKAESSLGPSRKYYRLSQSGMVKLEHFIIQWDNFTSLVRNILKGEIK